MIPMKMHFGVIEDNSGDPLKLGRCKVRVIGVHTEDKSVLSVSDLPWATPVQGITSAAMSGVGDSPTGLLPGSTVIVVFADGESCQVPLILGTIAGIPQGNPEEYITGDVASQPIYSTGDDSPPVKSDGDELKTSEQGGGFIPPKPEPIASGEIGPLTNDQYLKYREAIGKRESGGNYAAINTLNYLGKYQFGAAALTDFGYIKKGYKNKDLKNTSAWVGKNDITSHLKFLEKKSIQDECMKLFTKQNFTILRRKGVLRNDSNPNHCAGLLAVSHLKGPGDGIKYGRGEPVNPDGYGTSPEKYYKLGYSCLDGEMPKIMPSDDSSLPIEEIKETTSKGFSDPNGVWPRKKYLREPDTSRLSRAQGISSTVVGKKESSRTQHIRVANSESTWDQPHIPYATVYPHNKVRSTENGLVEEFDDTDGAIRYHLYHPAGTFTEIDNNGTKVSRIVGDNYEIIDRNGYIYVKGDCNITVEGNAKILVQEKCDLEVYGDCDAVFKNNLNKTVHGSINTFVQEDININCRSFNVNTFNGDINMVSEKSIKSLSKKDILFESYENYGAKSGKQFSMESTEELFIKSESKIVAQSDDTFSIKSGENINMDGTEIHLQEGLSSDATSTKDIIENSAIGNNGGSSIQDHIKTVLPRQELIDSNISQISPPPSYMDNYVSVYESPDDGDITEEYKQNLAEKLISIGEIEMAKTVGVASGTSSQTFSGGNSLSGKNVDCSLFINDENIPMGMQLSDNYSLKQFASSQMAPKKIVPQHGISTGELVCNLKHLAINVMEEVRKLYPEVKITSGLRYGGAGQKMDPNKKRVSGHEKGQAVDLQFGSQFKPSDYFDIAKELASKIDYDQLILEYSNNFRTAWIHISYNPKGNRKMLLTYNNQSMHSARLSKLV
jgi:hypothetical protein